MNRNAFGLQVPGRSRSKGFKSGACGVCFAHRFYPDIVRSVRSKASECRLEPLNGSLWYGPKVRANALPSQTASPESIVLRYFPL
jgi:hypothetical protein